MIRFILALTVILSHSYILATGSYAREPFYVLSDGHATGGGLAVDGFFLVSGFLIASSYGRSKSLRDYFSKRVRRIYPAFVVVWLLLVAALVPLEHARLPGDAMAGKWVRLCSKVLTLSGPGATHAFPQNSSHALDGSLWTIRFEFLCYLGLALLGAAGALTRRRILLCITTLLWLLSVAVELKSPSTSGLEGGIPAVSKWVAFFVHSCHFAPLFLAGAVAWEFRDRFKRDSRWAAACAISLALAALVPGGLPFVLPWAGMYVLLYLAYAKPRLTAFFNGRDFSYGTYLFAYPVQQLIVQRFHGYMDPLLLFALATPPTLVLAVISWHGVERRFLRRPKTAAAIGTYAAAAPVRRSTS